jgi:hypothetical protein
VRYLLFISVLFSLTSPTCRNSFAEAQPAEQIQKQSDSFSRDYIGDFTYPCGKRIRVAAQITPLADGQCQLDLRYFDKNSIATISGKSKNNSLNFAQQVHENKWSAAGDPNKITGSVSGKKNGEFALYRMSEKAVRLVDPAAADYSGELTYGCGRKIYMYANVISPSDKQFQLHLLLIDRGSPVITFDASSQNGPFSFEETRKKQHWLASIDRETLSGSFWGNLRGKFILHKGSATTAVDADRQADSLIDANSVPQKMNPRSCAP